jgi:hypothetical protein
VLEAPLAPAYFCFFKNAVMAFLISQETERSSRRDIAASAFACPSSMRIAISFLFTAIHHITLLYMAGDLVAMKQVLTAQQFRTIP